MVLCCLQLFLELFRLLAASGLFFFLEAMWGSRRQPSFKLTLRSKENYFRDGIIIQSGARTAFRVSTPLKQAPWMKRTFASICAPGCCVLMSKIRSKLSHTRSPECSRGWKTLKRVRTIPKHEIICQNIFLSSKHSRLAVHNYYLKYFHKGNNFHFNSP